MNVCHRKEFIDPLCVSRMHTNENIPQKEKKKKNGEEIKRENNNNIK
jgi:hypothetical protein